MDEEPGPLSYATPGRPSASSGLMWAGTGAVALALLQVPWTCAGLSATPSPSAVTHGAFTLLRAVAVAPAIGSTALACATLFRRRPGRHRELAGAALLIDFVLLLLLDYAAKWHAGD